MRKWILFISLAFCTKAFTQDNTTWVMNPTKDDARSFMKNFYQFKTFKPGYVVFKDSSFITSRFNYHRYSDEIHFISEKNDTLSMKNQTSVLYVVMGRDTFFRYKDGFIQKVTANGNINLGVKSAVQLIAKEKKGLYDSYTGVSSADNLTNFSMDNQLVSFFNEDANYKFKVRDFFFFIDNNYRFYPVKRITLLQLMPGKSKEINAFLDENNTNFDDQQSLLQLMWFLKWL